MPIASYSTEWAFAYPARWPRIPAIDRLCEGIEMCEANGQGSLQRLLYLQTESTSVDSEVIGMSFVEDGEIRLPPDDPDDWPYANVLEAMKEGRMEGRQVPGARAPVSRPLQHHPRLRVHTGEVNRAGGFVITLKQMVQDDHPHI